MDDPAQRAAEKLTTLMNSWRSIEIVTETRQSISPSLHAGPAAERVRVHYIETARGQRFLDQYAWLSDGHVVHSSGYCDGRRCAEESFDSRDSTKQTQLVISRTFSGEDVSLTSHRPEPLRFLYVGLKPLPEALRNAELIGEEHVADRPCDVFLFRDVPQAIGKVEMRYALDRETGITLAVDGYKTEADFASGRPYRTWRATRVDSRDGHPMVVEATDVSFSEPAHVPKLQVDAKVIEVAFNKSYPESQFWPVPQPGVRVFDSIAKTMETIPGGPSESPGVGATEPPLRADSGSGWEILPGLSLGLGTALVGVALVLWWKRRA
jgi:hypothetical protein